MYCHTFTTQNKGTKDRTFVYYFLGSNQNPKESTKDKDFKRMRVLFDLGCAATLVNHKKFLKKLKKKDGKNTISGKPKQVLSKLSKNASVSSRFQSFMHIETFIGMFMRTPQTVDSATMI
jgi:hypothetical protein